MTNSFVSVLTIALTLTISASSLEAQSIHPKKSAFRDVGKWATSAPGKIKLKNFEPFRAVYDRTYKQGSGANRGEARNDRVIISAENVGWDGKDAVAITLIDSGIEKQKDTNARLLTMFVDRKDMSLLFEMGPIPGKAKDYYIARLEKDSVYINNVSTRTQKLEPKKFPNEGPSFGPSAWAMACSGLRKGKKIKLAAANSPPGNPLTAVYAGYILKKENFKDGSGQEHDVWVLETTKSFTNSKVSRLYLQSKPPYYFGTETVDLDSGERKRFVWLRDFQTLKNDSATTN